MKTSHYTMRFLAVCLPLATGLWQAHSQIVDDNFDDANDNGWTRYEPLAGFGAPGIFSFPNGGYRIQATPSPDPLALGAGRAGSFRLDQFAADFALSYLLVGWESGINQSFGGVARASSTGFGSTAGYSFTYSTDGSLAISRIDNDTGTRLSSVPFSLDPAHRYLFLFTGTGSSLRGEVFDASDLVNAIARVTVRDSTYSGGAFGLHVFSDVGTGRADATFDFYQAGVNIPEPSTFSFLVFGLGFLLWKAWSRRKAGIALDVAAGHQATPNP